MLKIHGSLNWSYCPGCHRLDLGVSKETGQTYKMLEELYHENPLERRYSCQGFACPDRQTSVEPVLITPTQRKDYRNPHVARVWALAERALRDAKRAIIVGYSLPDDDLDVIYLLKRGLGKLAKDAPKNIVVVEKATDPATQKIGTHPEASAIVQSSVPDIDWRTDGFEGLIARLRETTSAPSPPPNIVPVACLEFRDLEVCCVVSGGNVDPAVYRECIG